MTMYYKVVKKEEIGTLASEEEAQTAISILAEQDPTALFEIVPIDIPKKVRLGRDPDLH
jgi:hypothetical protein